MRYTLVRHPHFTLSGDVRFKQAVGVASAPKRHTPSYATLQEAQIAASDANGNDFPPKAPGTFKDNFYVP